LSASGGYVPVTYTGVSNNKMKNSSIDFDTADKIIYVCVGAKVYVYSTDMRIVDEISLDLSILEEEEVTYFRFCEVSKTFHLIASNKGGYWRDTNVYSRGTYLCKFTINGDYISRVALTQKTIILSLSSDGTFELLHNSDSLGMHHFYDEDDWKIVPKHKDSDWIDLSFEYVEESENVSYEYITYPVTTNQPYQFAFITTNANYGSQGVQILNLNLWNKLELVYEIFDIEEDGILSHLTFNPTGNKFSILLLDYKNSRCSILVYSTDDNSRPLQLLETDFKIKMEPSYLDNIEKTQYLNDNLLCIIRYGSIVIFNLKQGNCEKILHRDLNSPYRIYANSIIYYSQEELKLIEL
jgi:hypothetical protein